MPEPALALGGGFLGGVIALGVWLFLIERQLRRASKGKYHVLG